MANALSGSALKKPGFAGTYRLAEEAWFQGDYEEARRLLASAVPRTKADVADRALLAARIQLRTKKYEEALRDARAAGPALDPERRATSLMLQGAALARMGRLDEAQTVLDEASPLIGVQRTIGAEILLQLAFVAWLRRDTKPARALAVKAIGRADDIVLARAQEMLGFVNATEEKYADAVRSFRQALATLATAKHRDEQLRVNLVAGMIGFAVDRLDADVMPEIRAALAGIRWTDEMSASRFVIHDMLGWLALIVGQPEVAWRDFTDARAFSAEGSVERLTALTSLATLHRTTDEPFAARQHIELAAEVARGIDWASTNMGQRAEYLLFVAESARLGQPVSMDDLKRFDALPAGPGDNAFTGGDRRYRAVRLAAHGLSLSATRRDRATKLLKEALETWLALGFRFRAAVTALDLYQVAEDREYLAVAQRETKTLRTGFLAKAIRTDRRREERGVGDLTAAERAVLANILDGKSNAAIAEERGSSLQTIKNQTRSIFQSLNVGSRGELFVVCRDLGITSSSLEA